MPFTPAHPAIVVPLARASRGAWPLSALVVGGMAPDFEYFVFLRPVRTIGHELIGIPLLCVPSGLAVLWAFHRVLKRPLALLLPDPWRRRVWPACTPFAFGPPRRLLGIVAALAVGAVSHIAWDSFTHDGGWGVRHIPPLGADVIAGVPAFKVIQHVSTLLGLGLLATWSSRWLRSLPDPGESAVPRLSDGLRRGILAGLALASCVAGAIAAAGARAAGTAMPGVLGATVIATIAAGCGVALLYGLAWHAWPRRG